MKYTESIKYVSIAVIAVSLFFIGVNLTGHATTDTETGAVNVTIDQSGALNFTTTLLNFGSGSVTGGEDGANLSSVGPGSTIGGTWTNQSGQLALENIGNVNVSLTLNSNNTAADFIGGVSPTFKAKVSNKTGNAFACTGAGNFSTYQAINLSLTRTCTTFGYESGVDEIEINFQLYIPNDATGDKATGITAIGTY